MLELVSGGAALLAILIYALIAWRIRTSHPQEWGKLGSPASLYDPTDLGGLNLAEYVWKGRWIGLNDLSLYLLCISFFLSVAVMVLAFLGVTVV